MSDDISWCMDAKDVNCKQYVCERHPHNMSQPWFPHSYMHFYGTEFCFRTPKTGEERKWQQIKRT